MKLMNENRCHIENIKGLENHQGILKEHVIGREKMIQSSPVYPDLVYPDIHYPDAKSRGQTCNSNIK